MNVGEAQQLSVLDHGYIQFIESWGSDERIIESARMSTNKGFLGWDKDLRLLDYLYTHKHMTPFEMCGMTLEIKAPIFVFREWHRHRTQSYSEMSARYIPMPDESYVPSHERIVRGANATGNKQAQGTQPLAVEAVGDWLQALKALYDASQRTYALGLELGIPKELARLSVTVARYSKMRASANLRNWLQFLTLRMDPAAQWEIRAYANQVGYLISRSFPRTWELFEAGRIPS